ncbi:hypothetical protein TNCV_1938331 [Trichonephila clavipes]|nr:hypothetical protein TNCV_1938331 [Trichonephila clavipes]
MVDFRIATIHDCPSKHLYLIGIAQSPLWKLCDSNEEWTPFIRHAAVYSALDPCGTDIERPNTKCPVWKPRFETAHSTACLRPVRKALFLIRVSDSWSASPSKTLGFSSPLPQTISSSLFRALFSSFSRSPFFLRSPLFLKKNHFKHQGCVHNTPLAPSYSQVTKVSLDLLLLPIGA